MSIIDLLARYHEALANGMFTTVKLAGLIWVVGIVLGTVLAALSSLRKETIGRYLSAFFFLIGSTPILVILFWLHYPAQSLLGVVIDPFWTTVAALSLVNTGLVAGVIRPAIEKFPREYVVAGKICGLSNFKIWEHIYFPLIVRQVLPSIVLTQVVMLHATLFASLISVDELFRVFQQINAIEYQPVKLYSVLAIFYIAISAPLNYFALWMSKKYGRNLSEVRHA